MFLLRVRGNRAASLPIRRSPGRKGFDKDSRSNPSSLHLDGVEVARLDTVGIGARSRWPDTRENLVGPSAHEHRVARPKSFERLLLSILVDALVPAPQARLRLACARRQI